MTPLPTNPKVVILINEGGNTVKIASNIAELPELDVKVVYTQLEFDAEAAGKPFNQVVYQNHLNGLLVWSAITLVAVFIGTCFIPNVTFENCYARVLDVIYCVHHK